MKIPACFILLIHYYTDSFEAYTSVSLHFLTSNGVSLNSEPAKCEADGA